MEQPYDLSINKFNSPILKKIYDIIEGQEISVFDNLEVHARNKAIKLIEMLNGTNGLINLDKLRSATFKGIPDTNKTGQCDLRSIVWRVLLGVYSLRPEEWEEKSKVSHETYTIWKNEFVITNDQISLDYEDQMLFARDFQTAKKEHREKRIYEIRNKGKPQIYTPETSKISEGKYMTWYTFFQDQEVLDEIEKDVKRTRTEMNFFCNAVDPAMNIEEN